MATKILLSHLKETPRQYIYKSLLLKKYKTFFISTRVEIGKTRNFTQFRVFPIFTSVDITVYQYGKNVLYFFYNIAQI